MILSGSAAFQPLTHPPQDIGFCQRAASSGWELRKDDSPVFILAIISGVKDFGNQSFSVVHIRSIA